jgi:hypothetical protein
MTMQVFDELTTEELDRIERCIRASTAGPWFSYVVGRDADTDLNYIETGSCNEVGTFKQMELHGASAADQDFIANARQDVPRLLAEVRRLRARLQSQRAAASDLHSPACIGVIDTPASRLPSSVWPEMQRT